LRQRFIHGLSGLFHTTPALGSAAGFETEILKAADAITHRLSNSGFGYSMANANVHESIVAVINSDLIDPDHKCK
jgi:hypothetical protein